MFSSRSTSSVFIHLKWIDVLRAVGVLGLVVGLGLVGCDSSNGGPPPSELEGTYLINRMEFTVSGVDDFDILADTLESSSNSPRMEFFGGNATVNLVYRLEGSSGSSLLAGQFTTGNDRVTLDFSNEGEESRFEVLLPAVVRLERRNNGDLLVANQEVRDVNLRKYAPGRYGGLTQNVNGTLRMTMERTQSL